jgi:hypothetical protein
MRARVVVQRDHGSGLEFELGDADAVFEEEDFFRAAVEDVEAAVVLGVRGVPVGGRVAQLFVLDKFDGDVAKGLGGEIAEDVSEGSGNKADISVGQREGNGIFAFDGVHDFRGTNRDEEVVVPVPVHESFGVRRNVDVEDADLIVGENEVVVGFGGDFDFWLGWRCKKRGEKQEEYEAVHCGDCSIG